eukprot:1156636-Pelagomonas_calceolata.AAC.18
MLRQCGGAARFGRHVIIAGSIAVAPCCLLAATVAAPVCFHQACLQGRQTMGAAELCFRCVLCLARAAMAQGLHHQQVESTE